MTNRDVSPETPDESGVRARDPWTRAFLVTMHGAGVDASASFVTVQASHSNRSRRFADLASAFRYLAGLEPPAQGEEVPPEAAPEEGEPEEGPAELPEDVERPEDLL